jgi:hypothetical protein
VKRRLLTVVGGALLLLTLAGSASADYRSYPHWHNVQSYISNQDGLGQWRVTAYYYVKMNGSSPAYIPSVKSTAPMWCDVPYAIATDVRITYCAIDRLTYYSPDRWRVTVRWNTCFWIVCSSHGMNLTFRATGTITERTSW